MISIKDYCIKTTNILMVLSCILLSGCCNDANNSSESFDDRKLNEGLINSFNDTSMENAIISQHTLYPYHFINDSPNLNDLGMRDLSILAKHFKDNPGQLNVSHQNANEALYAQRTSFIAEQLNKSGVDMSKIIISDGMPGGSSMSAEDVLLIRAADQKVRDTTRKTSPQLMYDRSNR